MQSPSPTRRAALACLSLAACSPSLGTFDDFAPKDEGRLLQRGIAYGDDPRQALDVYAPETVAEPLPVIVFIHGGSWSSGSKDDHDFAARAFTSRDYIAVLPNYRLVPGVRFPSFIEDCARALRWTQDHIAGLGGDPSRIVLCGHSAGAYIAIMLALDAQYCADAGVDVRRIKGAIGLAGPYAFYPFDVPSTVAAFGQAPDPDLTQPTHFARADAPPLFLGWGAADDIVGRQNIVGLERAMRARGGAVETRIYPDVDHADILLALSRPFRGRAPVLDDLVTFANRVTRA